MAGEFPDVVAPRMAWDRDGSSLLWWEDNQVITEMTASDRQAANDEGASLVWSSDGDDPARTHAVLFPELRDIRGVYCLCRVDDQNPQNFFTSTDTTNGIDGTWVDQGLAPIDSTTTAIATHSRNNIVSVTWNGIKAVRFRVPGGGALDRRRFRAWHFYGFLSTGESPDRLRLWHPTQDSPLDDELADGPYFDWGDVTQGAVAADLDFRVKNISTTDTANTVSVDLQALTDTSPTIVSQHSLSDSGGAFSSSLSLGNIAPDTIYPAADVLTLRREIDSSAGPGPWALRIVASAGSWS